MSQTPSEQAVTYDGAYGTPQDQQQQQPVYYANNDPYAYGPQGQGNGGYGGQQQYYGGGGGYGKQPEVETEPPRSKLASPMVGVGVMAGLVFLTVIAPMIILVVLYSDATTIF